jgi:uncharacterized membrane protein
MDTKFRTIVKTISYRTAVALGTLAAAAIMNYTQGFALSFIIISFTLGALFFAIHERIWNRFQLFKDGAYDTKTRSVLKTVSWRVFSFIAIMIIGLAMGLSANDSFEWTIVTNLILIVVHYVHERIWNQVNWGKIVN